MYSPAGAGGWRGGWKNVGLTPPSPPTKERDPRARSILLKLVQIVSDPSDVLNVVAICDASVSARDVSYTHIVNDELNMCPHVSTSTPSPLLVVRVVMGSSKDLLSKALTAWALEKVAVILGSAQFRTDGSFFSSLAFGACCKAVW